VVSWIDDKHLAIGDKHFTLEPLARVSNSCGAFVLRKTRWMTEQYLSLAAESRLDNIFELGIDQGGSTALLALLFRPRKLVAIDIDPEPKEVLTQLTEASDDGTRVSPHYGIDQADRRALEAILQREFGGEPLDLVVDDASHEARETTASFNILFPRLRPGGCYVIEDWEWDHAYERAVRVDPRPLGTRGTEASTSVGPSRLVLELALASGSSPETVSELTIRHGFVTVRRGPALLDAKSFEISACYGEIGRRVLS
jgi:predicted O-methyltransferase YrrM